MLPPCGLASLTFITRVGFSTSTLAYMLDSLVRVSRRVGKNHFGKIARSTLGPHPRRHTPRCLANQTGRGEPLRLRDPILPHDGGQASRFPRYKPQPYSVLTTRNGLATNTDLRRRINFYRFLLNDFKSFDSLFKVLFIFPSQYLFAIGFPYIFSLRRSLSPT
jgi:hypothetical protein